MGLSDDLLSGSQRALARLATHVENDDEVGRVGLLKLYPHTGKAHIVGITGPPGAGKSTLINGLIADLRSRGHRVGVIAIDPTSPVSGGATLGDRIRMLERQSDSGVFIRSMASRGQKGGLAPATSGLIHLLDAAGYDFVIVETVGVGQEEVDVSRLVHSLVLVQIPGTGDGVQLLKAGLLELADVYVVNKADLAGAEELIRGLRSMIGFAATTKREHVPAVVRCVASENSGVDNVASAILKHWDYMKRSGLIAERNRLIAKNEIESQIRMEVSRRLIGIWDDFKDDSTIDRVASRELAPSAAAVRILSDWNSKNN